MVNFLIKENSICTYFLLDRHNIPPTVKKRSDAMADPRASINKQKRRVPLRVAQIPVFSCNRETQENKAMAQ